MRVKTLAVLTLFVVMSSVCAYAQEAILAIEGDPCADAGATGIEVNVTLDNSNITDDVAGFQFDLNFDKSALTKTDVTATSRSEGLSIFSASDTDDGIRVVATGIGQTVLETTGPIVTVTFDVDAGAAGDYDLTFVNPKVANPQAQALPLSVENGVFSVPCGGGEDEAILAVEDACGDPGTMGVEVNVTLDNSAVGDVAGFQFDLNFDKTALTVNATTDVVPTSRSEGLSIFSASNTDGGIRVVATGIGETVLETTGPIVTITFGVESGASGDYDLTFVNPKVANPQAEALPLSVVNGVFTAPCTGVQPIHENVLPTKYALTQNYPNPFNPTTSIDLSVPASGMVEAVIYNVIGQKIRTLVNEELPAGYYTLSWDGLSEQGNPVTSGVYFCRVKAGTFSSSVKMLLLK